MVRRTFQDRSTDFAAWTRGSEEKKTGNAKAKTKSRRRWVGLTWGTERREQAKEPNGAVKKKKVLAANTALSNYAARSLGPLQKSITCLNKTVDKVNQASCKVGRRSPEDFVRDHHQAGRLGSSCRSTVNSHESTREMWKQEDADLPSLEKLPFDSGDLKAGLKQAQSCRDVLKQLLPVKEPKAKAKAKAKSDPKAPDADGQPGKRCRIKSSAWRRYIAPPLTKHHCVDKHSGATGSIGLFCPTGQEVSSMFGETPCPMVGLPPDIWPNSRSPGSKKCAWVLQVGWVQWYHHIWNTCANTWNIFLCSQLHHTFSHSSLMPWPQTTISHVLSHIYNHINAFIALFHTFR